MISETMLAPAAIELPDPQLAALYRRALATDSDRPTWLHWRRTGLTATDMKIIMRSQAATVEKHLADKDAATDADFTGNKNTIWGNYREAIAIRNQSRILEDYPASDLVRCGVLFHAEGNKRFLCTPDLVGVNFETDEVEIAEVKTSNAPLPTSSKEFAATRYLEQIEWQMFVTGAARCFYINEVHDDDWSRWKNRPLDGWTAEDGTDWSDYGPKVLSTNVEVIERTPMLEEKFERYQEKALAALRRLDAIQGAEPDPEVAPEVVARVEALGVTYAAGMVERDAGEAKRKGAQADLMALFTEHKVGMFDTQFDSVKVLFQPPAPTEKDEVDEKAALADTPADLLADAVAARGRLDAAKKALAAAQAAAQAVADQIDVVRKKHTKKVPGNMTAAKVTVTPKKEKKNV